jgi:hypothetical protein
MKPMSNEAFQKAVMKLAEPQAAFQPVVFYNKDGDCIEFIAKPDMFYAERIDDLVTVYYSQETKEIIGSMIKGIKKFCQDILKKYPGFRIEIHDGRVSLAHIFRAYAWSQPFDDDLKTITYQKLIEYAQEADAKADLCLQ